MFVFSTLVRVKIRDNGLQSDEIKSLALQCGFDECKIVAADSARTFSKLLQWLDSGYGGSMQYLTDRAPAYEHPQSVLANVKSLIMLVLSYHHGSQTPRQSVDEYQQSSVRPKGRVASYASSGIDYHDVIHDRSKQFIALLKQGSPSGNFRCVVDTAPLLEREFAMRAGLGWIGKNTMLISRTWGSYFFIAAVLSDQHFNTDAEFESDHCGTCTACLTACPTQAFVQPRQLDATRCISYYTIEERTIAPNNLREQFGDWVFGCDVCQEVCPWNRKARLSDQPTFRPILQLANLDLIEVLRLDDASFRERFRHSPFWRTKLSGLQRNALMAIGNQKSTAAIPPIVPYLTSQNIHLRLAATWALGQINDQQSRSHLERCFADEKHPLVIAELKSALRRD